MSIFEMYEEMEKAIEEEQRQVYFDGLKAIAEMELYDETKPYCDEYDSIMETNYSRKRNGKKRYKSLEKEKKLSKVAHKTEEDRVCNRYGVCDNGHYFVSPTNYRGAYTIVLVEKKANRKRKHTLADDIAEYEEVI